MAHGFRGLVDYEQLTMSSVLLLYFGPEANPGIWVEEAGGSRAAYHKPPWQQRGQRVGTRCLCRMCPLAYQLQLDLISNHSVL